ncbi:MAG: SDR family NAD(P)-dependent oxidoreductase [Erythrobacter sp.]
MTQVAVITGTSSGLGKALHEALLARGWPCISIARAPARRHVGVHITADLATSHDWPAQLAPLLSQLAFARLYFFDIAAVLPRGAMLDAAFVSRLEEAMQVNVLSPLAIASALAELARNAGARLDIVHTSSGAASRAIPNWGAYCASKATAAIAWQGLAAENDHITAHICQPGVIDTPMQARLRDSGDPGAASCRILRCPGDVAADILAEIGLAP